MVAGQLVIAGVGGTEITPGLRHLILDDKVGGVILFRSNFIDAGGLQRWCRDLQALGREAGLPAPLLVTLDEEGGDVQQLDSGIPLLPSARSLGAQGPAAVRSAVAGTARGLHALGLTLDLAPVADLRTNPADGVIGDRSFGADPASVGPLVSAYIAGLHDGDVGATLKHFPGLGGAAGDPHRALPTDDVTVAAWQQGSARSFAAGIDAGADAVMTTAVSVPSLDPTGRPAMFSAPIISLLRHRLGFDGVIVSDSLSMGGVGAIEDLPHATVDAIAAGNDTVILANSDTDLEDSAVRALHLAIGHGIGEAAARASAERVIKLRRRYATPSPSASPTPSPSPRVHPKLDDAAMTPVSPDCPVAVLLTFVPWSLGRRQWGRREVRRWRDSESRRARCNPAPG
jgi:beta-N-acetylhexosaminidase